MNVAKLVSVFGDSRGPAATASGVPRIVPATGVSVDWKSVYGADPARESQAFWGQNDAAMICLTAGDAFTPRPLADLDFNEAHAILDVRFWGAVTVIMHAAPRIRPGGSIGLTTGTVGQRPVPGAALAAAGAGAAEGLVRGLAVELAPVRVNAVRAGTFRTPLWDRVPEAQREALFTRLAQGTLTKTVGDPEQIAAAHIYLMQNLYVTGTVQTVDGGLLLTGN